MGDSMPINIIVGMRLDPSTTAAKGLTTSAPLIKPMITLITFPTILNTLKGVDNPKF